MTTMRKGLDLKRYPGFRGITWACMLFLYGPIIVIAIYSFNEIRSITVWGGFSLDWYVKVFNNELIQRATLNSLMIAFVAATVATVFATAAAVAMIRGAAFKGKEVVFGMISLPLMVPEIVTAIASLVFFVLIGMPLGLGTITLAHTVFCIPFAYLPISARLEGIEAYYEEAARDLYADGWRAFVHVLFPLMLPGIISGFMLAFIISLDDFHYHQLCGGTRGDNPAARDLRSGAYRADAGDQRDFHAVAHGVDRVCHLVVFRGTSAEKLTSAQT